MAWWETARQGQNVTAIAAKAPSGREAGYDTKGLAPWSPA